MKRSKKEEEDSGFKCKTCNKMFPSFQALGGHRASHNKLKQVMISDDKPKPKMHLCTICGLEFAIGQALGGHMRKHRVGVAPNDDGFNLTVHDHAAGSKSNVPKRLRLCLDLNLMPYENDLNLNLNLGTTPILSHSFL